jgi:hypothetical protein
VQQHVTISKPVALAVLFALGLVSGVMAYVNHRLMMWYFSRRARRRAGTPIFAPLLNTPQIGIVWGAKIEIVEAARGRMQ